MIVCVCERVSCSTIKQKAAEGCDFQQIQCETGACTNCQICRLDIEDIIDRTQGRLIKEVVFGRK